MLFDVPKDYAHELLATKKEGSAYRIVDGVVKGRLGSASWYTNLDYRQRHEDLILYKKYSPDEFPTYDNYDAIEVSKTADIPMDWAGAMGVPITFLNKHNPDQFEMLGATESEGKGFSAGLWKPEVGTAQALVKGKRVYKRIFIRNKRL